MRDTFSIEESVDRLLQEISTALRAVNPNALIEFRQTYVGPLIRKFGNMLRVFDCPADAFVNRPAVRCDGFRLFGELKRQKSSFLRNLYGNDLRFVIE